MTHTLEHYEKEYGKAHRAGEPAWLARTRDEAFRRFRSLGFPTTKDEEWRFTSVAPIAAESFALADPLDHAVSIDVEPFRLQARPAAELVFINGRHAPQLSRVGAVPDGVVAASLASREVQANGLASHLGRVAPVDRHAFTALNTAFFGDGVYIHVPARTRVAEPIHVLFVATAAAGREKAAPTKTIAHPRVLIVLDESSQASVVVSYVGDTDARYFTNAVTEIVLAENAVLDHYTLQRESEAAYHVGGVYVRAERNGTVASHSISLGGALVRNDVIAVLDGEGAECTLNGLYFADRQRLVDNHTTIDHAKPHCGSRETYKGILTDRARGVFNGKIIVRPDAQKTDAKQTNRALLLSEDAQINTKPQLEIFANDVKCTHGAAVGQLDEEALFYLRSRGLGLVEARRMLVQAFAADVLDRLPSRPVRAAVEAAIAERDLAYR